MEITVQERIRERFGRATNSYDLHAEAQRQICAYLTELLTRYGRNHFSRALEIGCGSGCLTQMLMRRCQVREWVLNDLCEDWRVPLEKRLSSIPFHFWVGDAEKMAFPGPFGLIASASALQWMRDLPRFFHKLASLLSPDGVLLFNTFTPENLREVRMLTGEGLTYPDTGCIREWLSADFRILQEEEQPIVLTFRHPLDVLRHLRYTGVTANAAHVWTRGRQLRFCQEYPARFPAAHGGVTLTYCPLYIVAVKKEVS